MTNDQTVSHAKPKAPKKAKPSAADQVAKMRHAVLAIAPQPAPVELVMMPLTLIETRAQVRTEFDEETLAELAADIAARGVLQPILLRPNPGMANFLVIAGERRFRAARLAQLENIPAIIGEIDDAAAAAMQIAENIQRENLSLADTAKAVRKDYELNGNSVTITAAKWNKSKGWISKRLAASCPNLRDMAREVLEGEFTEDLEIILTLDKLQALDWYECQQLCNKVKKGEAGRTAAREALAEAKEANDPVKRQQRQEEQEKKATAEREKTKAEREKQNAEWKNRKAQRKADEDAAINADPHRLLWWIERNEFQTEDGKRVHDIIGEMKTDTLARLAHHLELLHISGTAAPYSVLLKMHAQRKYTVTEMASFMSGMAEETYELGAILRTAREAMQTET